MQHNFLYAMKRYFLFSIVLLIATTIFSAEPFVSFRPSDNTAFTIAENGSVKSIYISANELEGVKIAAHNLQQDLLRVTGVEPLLIECNTAEQVGEGIVVGTIAESIIQHTANILPLDLAPLQGKREMYLLSANKSHLLIAGSDKRGAIYGIYELSRQMGVSPWYWFADAPVQPQEQLFVNNGVYTDGEPVVEYRGIFINDEWPSFGSWCYDRFGGINSKMYAHIFELLLRLKANFMWPAMWGSAFFADDPQNGVLADKMGIVMSTSHHEPMNLNQRDWKNIGGTEEQWNYVTNEQGLKDFWRSGIVRSKDWETLITVGMRGDGDMEMPNSGDNISLLERIVRDQRQIISEEMGKPAEQVPQVWALYKEVQDYYDAGMKVPDDIILLLCDDNWGNVRRVPTGDKANHPGGYGMYYHFDYVGGPRNSKWLNISPIPRVWEQMNLCYEYGINKIWIVNVGDLKPMEYPITFFCDMAWNPAKYNPTNLVEHAEEFCRSIFGEEHAQEAARLLRTYAKFNRRVTPELLNMNTYSFLYNEWYRVCADYNRLVEDARALEQKLPAQARSAYFQLLGMPIEGVANLYNLYYAQAMNKRLARTHDQAANAWAQKVYEYYVQDSLLSKRYHELEGGKWNHLMDEIRIGYKSWNTPEHRTMPAVERVGDGSIPAGVNTDKPIASAPYALTSSVKAPCTFVEKDGYITIEAEHYTRKTDGAGAQWTVIPELGRTLSGFSTKPITGSVEGASLEYDFTCQTTDFAVIILRLAPTLNYLPQGQRYAISIDGGKEKIVNINGHYTGELGEWQRNHCIDSQTVFDIAKPGKHTLRIRPLDNGIVFQKICINLGGLHRSYLWPEETLE